MRGSCIAARVCAVSVGVVVTRALPACVRAVLHQLITNDGNETKSTNQNASLTRQTHSQASNRTRIIYSFVRSLVVFDEFEQQQVATRLQCTYILYMSMEDGDFYRALLVSLHTAPAVSQSPFVLDIPVPTSTTT